MRAGSFVRRAIRRAHCVRSRWFGGSKVFCIGRNKTGTTTLGRALQELGYNVAPQEPAEHLFDDWTRRDFRRLIEFCRWYDAFQDIPFSLDDTYHHLDNAFPGSKFVLSVRESADQWFESVVRFQTALFGRGGQVPTWADLEAAPYGGAGFMARVQRALYGEDAETPYDRVRFVTHYETYNAAVRTYFAGRPQDFLEINVAAPESYVRFCNFLNRPPRGERFPWENASALPRHETVTTR